MTDVTRILSQIEQGDPHAAERLLPLVYDELRILAAQRLSHEPPGQTLQPTALVHEAYLRLVGNQTPTIKHQAPSAKHQTPPWNSRGHFFAAAAEAMRRILVDAARAKRAAKRGGQLKRQAVDIAKIKAPQVDDDLLDLNEALDQLAAHDESAARLVKLRFFAGLSAEQAAAALAISPRSADRLWNYARAFLLKALTAR